MPDRYTLTILFGAALIAVDAVALGVAIALAILLGIAVMAAAYFGDVAIKGDPHDD